MTDIEDLDLDIKIEVTSLDELREIRKEMQKIARAKKEIEESEESDDPLDDLDIDPKPDPRDPYEPDFPKFPKKDRWFISDTKQGASFETGTELTYDDVVSAVDMMDTRV